MERDFYEIKIAYEVICGMLNSGDIKPGEKSALTTVRNKLANVIAKHVCTED